MKNNYKYAQEFIKKVINKENIRTITVQEQLYYDSLDDMIKENYVRDLILIKNEILVK